MTSQTEPLIGAASKQTAVDVGAPLVGSSPSSTRACKVAGFTFLACLLIAGQGMAAYFVFRQGNAITSLEQQADKMHEQLSRPQPVGAASVPMKMGVSMKLMSKLDDVNEEGSSTQTLPEGPDSLSECQMEAMGLKPAKQRLPKFQPQCDEQGNYKSQQCWQGGALCWCVDARGEEVHGTFTRGPRRLCMASAGRLSRMLSFQDRLMSSETDE